MSPPVEPGNIGPVCLPGRAGDDNDVEIRVRKGAYLPHWSCNGGVYSVTFRLADSLPATVLSGWERERDDIVRRMVSAGRSASVGEQRRLRELHTERVERYLDQGWGACHLRDPRVAEVVSDALRHFDDRRYDLVAWCVMPNHVHTVVHPRPGFELPSICHSWKSFTAKEINRLRGRDGVVWQPESYDHLIRDLDDYEHAVEYVLANPSMAGLGAWPWVGRGTGFASVSAALAV